MSRHCQSQLEKEIVKIALAVLKRDWPKRVGEPFSYAALGEIVTGRRESTNVSRWFKNGELAHAGSCKRIGKLSEDAGALLLEWIPVLRTESSLSDLKEPLAHALFQLEIPEGEIAHAVASNAPRWPYSYRRTPKARPLALSPAELMNTRRFFDAGPIFLAKEQAWCTAISLLEAICYLPALGRIASRVWTQILENFVPPRNLMLRFGEHEDMKGKRPVTISTHEREFQYEALQDCIDAVVLRHENPKWTPLRLKHEFDAVRKEIKPGSRCSCLTR